MRDSQRRRRRFIAATTGLVIAFAISDGLLIGVGHAQQQDSQAANYLIYNGQVAATADREQVGTTVDPGFNGGAVNNFYPLARIDVAVAGTNATASPADTGPFAQAVFAGQNQQQGQYVNAQYPGTQNPPPYSSGSASAAASVTPASAKASATYGWSGNPGGTPQSGADGSDGGTASDSSYFDSALGFVAIGDSRVHRASYGAGTLVIDNVHVAVQVSTNGSGAFNQSISITVGGASVGGVPVTIDQNGVTVQQGTVPLGQLPATTAQVNAVLAAAGLSVHTVAPQVTHDGTNLHVEAVGVVVDQEQPVAPGGVPSQFVRHTLGVVILDNEATVAPPAVPASISGGTSAGGPSSVTVPITTTTTGSGPGGAGTTAAGAQPAKPAGVTPAAALVTLPRPLWLLLTYLAWQALMLALVAALYLRRSAQRLSA